MSTTERKVKTKFEGDASSAIRAARAAEREMRRAARAQEQIQRDFDRSATQSADRVLSAFSGITKGILSVGSAVSSAQGIAGATAAVTTLAGTAAAVPGILAAGAAAGGVFALAMSGMGDAIAAEDLEEFNKVTKDMAPNAVETARAIRDQKDRFTELRKVVQSNFFAGFDKDVRDLADRYFPMLLDRSGEIATELNKMGREATKALMDPKAVREVDQVLSNSRRGMEELRPALANVIKGFLGISSVGSDRFPAVSRAVTQLTADFDKWVQKGVESGKINEIIDDGIDTAKQFGRVLGNLGETGRAVWQGLSSGERDFLDGLEESTQMLEDFFESAEGQEIIRTLGDALQTTADVARDILSTALRELGPVVKELGPAFMEVVRAVGESLVSALKFAGPLLQDTARFLSENKNVIGDLVPLVLSLAVGYKGLSVARDAQAWIGGLSGAFGAGKKGADDMSAAVGKGGKGGGGTGLVGSLAGLAAIVGAGVVIDIVNDSEIAKANNFKISLDGILSTLGKIGENGALGLITKYNDAVIGGVGKAISGAQQGEIVLKISSDTSQAERNLKDLKDQVRRSNEFVTINGNRKPADQALADVVTAIDNGEGTVNVNGNTIDSQRALQDLIAQINSSSGTVIVDGNPVPAGQVLFGLLTRVSGSRATMSVDANDSAAQGVVNRFITMNNGRQIDIFVNAKGDAGGLASAGRLAIGGRPFDGRVRGPGTPTSDTAGLFYLSDQEHVLSAADVAALGGHQEVYRLRALARQGKVRGFADGGTPAFLTSAVNVPSSTPNVNVNTGGTRVVVMIDGQEFRGMISTAIERDRRNDKRERRAGSGAL